MSGYTPRHSGSKKKRKEPDLSNILGQPLESGTTAADSMRDDKSALKPGKRDKARKKVKGDRKARAITAHEDISEHTSKHKEKQGKEPSPPDDSLFNITLNESRAGQDHPRSDRQNIDSDTMSSEAEASSPIKRRKRRWPIVIAIIIAAIVIGGATTYYVLSSQALEREAKRTAGYELLDEAIALIQESDQLVVNLDTATTTEVSQANLSEREVILERVPTTLETLSLAEERARAAVEFLTSPDDKEFAQHVIDSAINRKVMLTNGEVIISTDIRAMNSALIFGQVWEIIINADTELRETTELSTTGGYNELREAVERNEVVLTSLRHASELLLQAKRAFEEADYTTISGYIALKIESVQLAIEADQAVLDGDIELFNTKNTEFGLKDAAVVNAAGKIPAEPLSLITDAYEAATAEYHALYDSARANAAEVDGYIREYVGVETQTGVQ